jgi:hypothetical protein
MEKEIRSKKCERISAYLIEHIVPEFKDDPVNLGISLMAVGTAILAQQDFKALMVSLGASMRIANEVKSK